MKYPTITNPVVIDLSEDFERIEIIPMADLHIGDRLADIPLMKKWVKYIQDNEHVFCVLNGDLMNNSLKNSVSNVYEDIIPPREQLETVYELFEPIKDKILFITSGNHERRSRKESDVDLTELLSIRWGIKDRYRLEGGVLVVRFGAIKNTLRTNNLKKARKVRYDFYITHGAGSAKVRNPAVDLMYIVDVDGYIHSHTHGFKLEYPGYHRMDSRNNKISFVDKMCMTTGAFLDYGGYGQIAKYRPTSKRQGTIYLDGKKKFYEAKA